MKHKRIPHIPLILMGTKYWEPIIDWIKDKALRFEYIQPAYLEFFIVTDSIDEAYDRIKKVCDQYEKHLKN